MEVYKSKQILLFKNKKILSLGESVTPKTVYLLSKFIFKNEFLAGRTIEVIIVVCFLLSIFFNLI